MANASTTGFGFRPIKMVGQAYNNAGLVRVQCCSFFSFNFARMFSAINSRWSSTCFRNTDANNLGTLNGVFYTDATSNKPTFSNFSPASNTATDIVAFVTTILNKCMKLCLQILLSIRTEVGHCADQVNCW